MITTSCFAYYLGADSFFVALKDGLFPTTSFSNFTFELAIDAFALTILNALAVTDADDVGGFFGKAIALSKGIIYKKTNYGHLIILAVYNTVLVYGYLGGDMKGETSATILYSLVAANWLIPIIVIALMDEERIKRIVGEPSEIEKKLSNKGADKTYGEAASRIDFWYMSITSMVMIGTSRMFDENAETLSLHDPDKSELITDTFGVYEIIGATIMGSLLTFFRA